MPTFKIPPYMEQGSKGVLVNALLSRLDPTATKDVPGQTGIKLDGELGLVGMRELHRWQGEMGISKDGGFGPEGRATARKAWGFDLESLAAAAGKSAGLTAFAQPEGSKQLVLYWAYGIEATPDLEAAEAALAALP